MEAPFSFRTCRYYSGGVCLYSETVNPGLEPDLRCPVLAGMIADWDNFLDRAEVFGLSERLAARIWNDRKHGCGGRGADCLQRDFSAPVTPETLAGCRHRFQNACLLAMPACGGPCERFVSQFKEQQPCP